jgi:hypothetical protein
VITAFFIRRNRFKIVAVCFIGDGSLCEYSRLSLRRRHHEQTEVPQWGNFDFRIDALCRFNSHCLIATAPIHLRLVQSLVRAQ